MPKPKMDRTETYTYEDYLTWDGPEQWELIDGVPFLMASPVPAHQTILLNLASTFHTHLQGKSCTPYISPLDVTFEENDQTKSIVQPDFFVMCGKYGNDKRIVGVPVLIVEILSPSTAGNDFVRKLNLYQRFGVQEYWVIEPDEKIINVYLHDGQMLRWTAEYKPGQRYVPSMFFDLMIDVSGIFA